MGNETGISRQKRPPAAQQPAASQSLTKDGPVSLNPSQDLDDTASGGGTTPDGDTTQGGGTTPDDDTTPGGGNTPGGDTTQGGGNTPDDDTTTPGGGTTQGGITIPGGGVEEALTLTVRYYIAGTNTPIAAPYRAELLPGSSYTVTSPTIEHYTLADPDQATVSGTLREDTVVTVYYRFAEQTAQYTVNYIGRVADKTQETVLATVTGTAPHRPDRQDRGQGLCWLHAGGHRINAGKYPPPKLRTQTRQGRPASAGRPCFARGRA